MAKILVIASGKGGSGKSTQSRNIIPVALAAGLRVVAFDADPQKTLLNFHAARMKRAEVPQCAVYAATIEDVVGLAREQRDVDLIIVDTPTALENSPVAVKQLLLASDLVLIPSQPTTDDVASVRTLMAAATALGKIGLGATDFIPSLETAARDDDPAVRTAAAEALKLVDGTPK